MKIQAKRIGNKWVVLAMCFMMELVCLGFQLVVRAAYKDKKKVLAAAEAEIS